MPALYFPEAEYKARLDATKREMARHGLDCLLVFEPSNIFYLTGFDASCYYTPLLLVVGLNEEQPIWIGRQMDVGSAFATTFLHKDNIRTYPDRFVQSPTSHPAEPIADIIKERGLDKGRIGVEMGAYYYTARMHAELMKNLPGVQFDDAELLINWVRIIKSPAEQQYMREAGRITDAMMRRVVEHCEPGVRECDVVAEVYRQQMSGTPEYGGVYATSPVYFCAGSRINTPHSLWTDEPLQKDKPLNVELSGSRLHYHAPMSRTIFLGQPPEAYSKFANAVVDGLEAALDSVRPGIACEDIEMTWRKTIAKHGVEKESRLGYSIGIGFPPTWGERTASLRPGDKTVLQPGMAFHCMAGIWLESTGVTITQSFIVTENGREFLTTFPRELVIKN